LQKHANGIGNGEVLERDLRWNAGVLLRRSQRLRVLRKHSTHLQKTECERLSGREESDDRKEARTSVLCLFLMLRSFSFRLISSKAFAERESLLISKRGEVMSSKSCCRFAKEI